MYFLVALACAVISAALWFFLRDRKELHLDILAITYGAATLMWFIDCIASAISEGQFLSFEYPTDGYISLATVLGGLFLWLLIAFILNHKEKSVA